MSVRRGVVTVSAALGLVVGSAGASGADWVEPRIEGGGPTAEFVGRVLVADQGIAGARVKVRVAPRNGKPGSVIGTGVTDADGRFAIAASKRGSGVLYLTSDGGQHPNGSAVPGSVRLATVIGDARPREVRVNELTTAASAVATAQFLRGGLLRGPSPGLSNAAAMTKNLVHPRTGRIAEVISSKPNGRKTDAMRTLNSLANIVGSCAVAQSACDDLLSAASGSKRRAPKDSWQAIADTIRFPSYRAKATFKVQGKNKTYAPRLDSAPKAWFVALKFVGNGRQFNGPGNIAIDADGNVWANNNYNTAADPKLICGGKQAFKLYPFRRGTPVVGYSGGGLDGAGFGIGIDTRSRIWVSNFGFYGKDCGSKPPANSISELRPNGTPVSGDQGYVGNYDQPQAINSDQNGNIWVANCTSGKVVRLPDGQNELAKVAPVTLDMAFDVKFTSARHAWVSSPGSNEVYGFDQDLNQVPGSPFRHESLRVPMGLGVDSRDNLWVANQGITAPPCGNSDPAESPLFGEFPGLRGKLTMRAADGTVLVAKGAGLTLPWGLAVDGNDNAWVANFSGQRLSAVCGVRAKTCQRGVTTGEGLSPKKKGYRFTGLQRNTGVAIDGSGNVWVTNNWKKKPIQIDPGGDGLVAFLGMAGPVRTPTIGPPQQP